MAYCSKCGAQTNEGDCFCPKCGETLNGAPYGTAPNLSQMKSEGHDYTIHFSPQDVEENKYICILCYLGILFVLPLIIRPESYFVKFHANQGLITFLLSAAAGFVAIVPLVGWVVSVVAGIAATIFVIMGIIFACQGTAQTLPIIGGISIIN